MILATSTIGTILITVISFLILLILAFVPLFFSHTPGLKARNILPLLTYILDPHNDLYNYAHIYNFPGALIFWLRTMMHLLNARAPLALSCFSHLQWPYLSQCMLRLILARMLHKLLPAQGESLLPANQ